jgi:acyl-CoA synthetase
MALMRTPSIDDPDLRAEYYESRGLWTSERIGWLVSNRALRWPDREFVLINGLRLTYREFDQWATAVSVDLVRRGVERGDRVVIQLPNRIEALVCQVAALRMGAISIPVIPIYREHEIKYILGDSRPAVVIAAAVLGDRNPCEELTEQLDEVGISPKVRYVVGGHCPGWSELPERPDHPLDTSVLPDPQEASKCAVILYTSGTTSSPKGVMLSSRAILSCASSARLTSGFGSGEVFFCCAPLSHLAGFIGGLIWPASLGARVVIMPAWNGRNAAELIEQERATMSTGAAVFLHDLVQVYKQGLFSGHRLTTFTSGGATTPPHLIKEAEDLGMTCARVYGLTETGGGTTVASRRDDLDHRAHFDARVLVGSEMEAVDPNRVPLPPGEEGELRIRSPQLMLSYTDPQRTQEQVDENGWFYTGDIGSVDKEGWLKISGRIKDIINRGGEKFSARDIEDTIVKHPSIAAAAVVGVPDDRLGEVVGAFVTLEQGAVWEGPDEFVQFLDEARLSKPKIPVEWYVLAALPQTASGKIQKHELLEIRRRLIVDA